MKIMWSLILIAQQESDIDISSTAKGKMLEQGFDAMIITSTLHQ